MIKLSEFDRIGGRRGITGLAEKCYMKVLKNGKNASKPSLYLKLSKRLTTEFTEKYGMGYKCRVFASPDFRQVVVARGDDKTVSVAKKTSGAGLIQCGAVVEDFLLTVGTDVDKYFYDGKWDTDENGNRVILLTHNGQVEK